MTFFHDLNKRLAALAEKQDLHESKVAESEKWIQKAVNPAHKGNLHKALHVAQGEKIPKAKIEKATHSKNPKLRHMAQFAKNVANEGTCPSCHANPCECVEEGNAFTGALAKTPKGSKFSVGGKEFTDTSSIEEEGGVPKTPKQKAFAKLAPPADKITFADKIAGAKKEVDEMLGDVAAEAIKSAVGKKKEPRSKGTAFDPEVARSMFAHKDEHPRHDVKDTGYSKRYTRKADPEDDADGEVKSDAPKKKGRPKGTGRKLGAKGPTGKSKLLTKTDEDLDTDGVMMTRPSNMSSEDIHDMEGSHDRNESGEYGAEGDYVKNELHTMIRVARDLERHLRDNEDLPTWCIGKLSQAKGMVVSVMDYIMSEKERGVEAKTGEEGVTMEKAPPGAKAERMVKHIKKAYSKDGKLTPKEKSIAYATTWKAHKQGKVEEEGLEKHSTSALKAAASKDRTADQKSGVPANFSTAQLKAELAKRSKVKEESTDKEDQKAERAGKKVAKDIEHDEGHKGKDDRKAEKAGKKVTKDIEYDDKKDRKEKEEKVDETTTSGSVAPAQNAAPKASKGMQFGKGVYEGMDKKFKQALTESINIESTMEECGDGMGQGVTIRADGEDAAKLMMLLKLAGLGESTCPTCGKAPCGCNQVDENSPDWPTDTEKLDAEPNLRTYSGGLNGPKSTGQSTTIGGGLPNLQARRQASMEESVELERSLFKLYKEFK